MKKQSRQEYLKAYHAKYWRKNKKGISDKRRASHAEYHRKNKEKKAAYHKKWREKQKNKTKEN